MDRIQSIKETQKAVDAAMLAVIEYLTTTDQPSSEQVHALIDRVLDEHNCESPEGHIVSSGKASAEPHEKGIGPIARGVSIVIDIYPRSKTTGYFADMTRTVCLGESSAELKKMYQAVADAHELAVSQLKAGVKCSELHLSVADFFLEAGYVTKGQGKEFKYAEGFVHSLGHGVGKEIHEDPTISPKSEAVLKAGDVITIEPGLYYPEIGGVRLEDMYLITETGAELLSTTPKQLEI